MTYFILSDFLFIFILFYCYSINTSWNFVSEIFYFLETFICILNYNFTWQ